MQSIKPDKGSCGFWSGVVKCWPGSLRIGESVKVVIGVKPQTGGWIVDHAYTWSDTTDPRARVIADARPTWVRSSLLHAGKIL